MYLDVHRGTHGGSQVGWAEGEEAQAVIVGEGNALLNVIDGSDEAAVHLSQVTSHLHGDETHMVLLVAPDQEGLVLIVEDTTSNRPVAASVGGL